MSDLTPVEKRKFERLLGMGSGYVLNFPTALSMSSHNRQHRP
jgi:hypothetical protein